MSRAIDEQSLFKPRASKAETKADITDHAARVIIGDEASRREAKTARLRQARLESEAKLSELAPPSKTLRTGEPKRRSSSIS